MSCWWKQWTRFKLSKAAVIILLWNTIVGVTYGIVLNGALAAIISIAGADNFHPVLYGLLGVFIGISLIQFVFYPVAGLLADICYGRYKVLMMSNITMCCGYVLFMVLSVLVIAKNFDIRNGEVAESKISNSLVALVMLLFIMGFSGFQANVVQFGLDQFLDAPSEKLSLLLHWLVWTEILGETAMRILMILVPCMDISDDHYDNPIVKVITYTPFFIFTILTVLITLSCFRRGWFHSEPRTHNPYGTVYKVLKFAAKHNRPLRRSAFTYCDDERPSRIELAKQRFGGPFTTETVEDVRTFLRILVMLVAIGPTYIVQVSTWNIFSIYGLYTGNADLFAGSNSTHDAMLCRGVDWVLLASGNMSLLVSLVFVPLYLTLILPCVRRWLPRILARIGVGLVLLVLADLSMTLTQLAGYYHLQEITGSARNDSNKSCLFNTNYHLLFHHRDVTILSLPSWSLLIPNVLTGLALPITYISILEFISAQSPHSMKGLLLGVFYAVRGLFTIIGCVLVFPFANNSRLWKERDGELFDCGLSYYTGSVLVGVAGLGLFLLTARWYQYRVRGDQPYGPRYVEAYYERVQEAACEPLRRVLDNSALNYGTLTD